MRQFGHDPDRMSGPLPVQVCTWLEVPSDFRHEGAPGATDGEWLYCLKFTEPGDRQVVWSGATGERIIAVVDFSGAVRPRVRRRGYEGWAGSAICRAW
jgi:hypothetical protein